MAWAFFLGPHVGLANAHPTSHTPTSYTPMTSSPPASNLRNRHVESDFFVNDKAPVAPSVEPVVEDPVPAVRHWKHSSLPRPDRIFPEKHHGSTTNTFTTTRTQRKHHKHKNNTNLPITIQSPQKHKNTNVYNSAHIKITIKTPHHNVLPDALRVPGKSQDFPRNKPIICEEMPTRKTSSPKCQCWC